MKEVLEGEDFLEYYLKSLCEALRMNYGYRHQKDNINIQHRIYEVYRDFGKQETEPNEKLAHITNDPVITGLAERAPKFSIEKGFYEDD